MATSTNEAAAPSTSLSPSVAQFAEVLSQESSWYTLGIFLEAPTVELKRIEEIYRTDSMRCLIELYGCLERKGKPLSWEIIATVLRRMGNNSLADDIHSKFILPYIRRVSNEEVSTEQPVAMDRSPSDSHVRPAPDANVAFTIENDRVEEVGGEFQSLTERFVVLTSKIKRSFRAASMNDIEELQDLIEGLCGIPPLPQDQAKLEAVFERLVKHCSILNFRPLSVVVDNLLKNKKNLRKELAKLAASVEIFKKSAKMVELVSLIQNTQNAPADSDQKKVKLKVREFWTSSQWHSLKQ